MVRDRGWQFRDLIQRTGATLSAPLHKFPTVVTVDCALTDPTRSRVVPALANRPGTPLVDVAAFCAQKQDNLYGHYYGKFSRLPRVL
jgi:hypothetical protein